MIKPDKKRSAMEHEKPALPGIINPIHKIAYIRNDLLNKILWVGFAGMFLSLALSIARAGYSGMQTMYVFDGIAGVIFTVVMIFRKRISYGVRFTVLIFLLFSGSIISFLSFSLLGYGVLFVVCSAILLATFTDWRLSIAGIGFGGVIILVFAYFYCTGRLVVSMEPSAYIRNPLSWGNLLGGFLAFSGMLVAIISSLIGTLTSYAVESEKNLREITQLNETLEKKVSDRTGELEQSNRDKDRILGVVAHDVNNKIVGILGYLDMLNGQSHSLSDSDRETFITKALEACVMSKDIVQDILEFSRNQSDNETLITEPVEIGSFTRSTVESHLPKAIAKGIDLTISCIPEHLFCAINRSKFSRVIDNLITNAIKFTPSGGCITVSIYIENDCMLWKISDTGIGIPETLKAHMFEPFTPSRRIGTEQETTTGLGLSISKSIVETFGKALG
jgi:signal transduction histidine kinase